MRKWIPPVAIVAAFAFSVAVYPQLPERIPVHWNLEGEPDGWAGGGRGAFVMPAFAAVLWLVMRFLPRIDPRKANYAKFDATYDFFVALIVSLVALLHIVTLGAALGWPVPVERVVPGIIGVAFVMIGNVLPRARPNWWLGVRTPWTMSSDRVWERTHRVAGYLLAGAGCLMILAALVPGAPTAMVAIGGIAAAGLGSVVYSYVAWRQEMGRA